MKTNKVRIPKQKRSIKLKETIKNTAKELFEQKGYHNTSSNEIVKVAGTSIGAFYSYFEDKKALFIELLHEYNQNIVSQVPMEELANCDIKNVIQSYIRAVLEAHNYSPKFHREILSLCYEDDAIKAIMDFYEQKMIEKIAELIKINKSLTRINDTDHAAIIIFKSIEEVVHSVKIFDNKYNEDALLRELTDMICLYVLV